MIDYVIYGKIIIDDIRLKSGRIVRQLLGGGGPQGAFGARLWHPSVALLTRSGSDIPQNAKENLLALDIDLSGWIQYDDLPTASGLMAYDENEYMTGELSYEEQKAEYMKTMGEMLKREIPIPDNCKSPKVIHLITEYVDEPIITEALTMKSIGSLFSLEPIIDYQNWSNRKAMLDFFKNVDVLTPDWPSASGMAESTDPFDVLKYWTKFGPTLVAIRNGVHGSYVWSKNEDVMLHIPVVEIDLLDPTGCGNAYGGGLCVGWDKHRSAKLAGCYATVSASFLAESLGVPEITHDIKDKAENRLDKLIKRVKKL